MLVLNSPQLLQGEAELLSSGCLLRADMIRDVVDVSISWGEGATATLTVLMEGVGELRFVFAGIRRLLLPDIGAFRPVLSEFSLLDVSERQLEGVRYLATDRDGSGFLCECQNIEIQRVVPSSQCGGAI